MGDVGIVVDPAIDPTSPPTSQEINVLVTGFGVRTHEKPALLAWIISLHIFSSLLFSVESLSGDVD